MSLQITEVEARLITNLTQVCRLCLSEESLEDIFKQEDLNIWISNFLSIVVSEDDKTSKSICASCRSRLYEFREYQLYCLDVQDVLLGGSTGTEEGGLSLIEAKEDKESLRVNLKQTTGVQEEKQPIEPAAEEVDKHLIPVIKKLSRLCNQDEVDESGRNNNKVLESRIEGHQNKHQGLFKCERGCKNVNFYDQQKRSYHYRSVHDMLQRKCDICHKSFRTKSILYHHIKSVHASKTYACPVCGKAFTTSSRLKVHERKHHCSLGSLSFLRKDNLKMHMKTHSRKSQEKDLAGTEDAQIEHVAAPDPEHTIERKDDLQPTDEEEVLCSICDSIIKKVYMEGHQNWHEGLRPYKCQQGCENFGFHCQLKRQQHYRQVHDRHECDICHKLYRSQRTLTNHKDSVHAPKTFGCSNCSRTFTTATRLKDHKMYTHNREKNHSCPKCNKLFEFKHQMAQHMQRHEEAEERMRAKRSIIMRDLVKTEHEADSEQVQDVLQGDSSTAMEEDLFEAEEAKIEPESDTEQSNDEPPSEQITVEKVKCSECGKNILEAGMEAHRNWHLGLWPYQCERSCKNAAFRSDQLRLIHYEKVHESNECDICHKMYKKKRTLMSHKRSVHGARDFLCDCGRSFTIKTRLTRHIKEVHKGEKYQSCPKCSQTFFRKAALIKHMKNHKEGKQRTNSTDLEDLAPVVKIEAREDPEQTVDIKKEPTDAATCSTQN